MNHPLATVRLELGKRLSWRCRFPSGKLGKWYKTSVVKVVPLDIEQAKTVMVAAGQTVDSETVFETGHFVKCPRCDGTGFYGGGRCFRCWGCESISWVCK